MADDIADRIAEMTEAIDGLAKAKLREQRAPSKAHLIGTGPKRVTDPIFRDTTASKASLWLDKALGQSGGYQPGSFLTAVAGMRGNPDEYAEAKATLESLGVDWRDIPDGSANKATLGITGATGGYVLPNNLVDQVEKPETAKAVWSQLVTVRNGVNVRGVDQPYRLGAPARMTFQDWGQTKENVSETYGSYTAGLGTMARIYDIGKQYMRFSAGAAEADVLDELTKAAILGENFYIAAGAGTGSTGVGDPTYGIYTALNGGPATYRTAFSSASNTTVAGSFASACAAAIKALSQRAVTPTAIVTDATTFWAAIPQGADAAGFWADPSGGPTQFSRTSSGQLTFWGVPIYYDPNYDTNTASTKTLICADFGAFKMYRGMEFRVDSSDQAGTRWDTNLIGSTYTGPWLQ